MKRTLKLVVLCQNHSLLSLHCLDGLLGMDRLSVCAGLFDPVRNLSITSVKRSIRSRSVGQNIQLTVASLLRPLAHKFGFDLKNPKTVRELLLAENAAWFPVDRINSKETKERLRQEKPDLLVIASFPQILDKTVLSIPTLGCINVHPSLLPRYRGAAPTYWVLRNKEASTGITVHFVDEGIDTGDIICQEEIAIEPGERVPSVALRLALLGRDLLCRTVALFRDGHEIPRRPQNEKEASYFPNPYK